MKMFLSVVMFLGLALGSFADGPYWAFRVEFKKPHKLIVAIAKYAVRQTPESKLMKQDNKNAVQILVTEAVYDAGYDALTKAEKEAYVDAVIDDTAKADNSSVDAKALIDIIAELTGTPVNEVKQKFKASKKKKEKK